MSEDAGNRALSFLKDLDVKVWLNAGLESYDGKTATLSNGRSLRSQTVIWTAGVTGSLIDGLSEDKIAKGNRFKVDHFNRVQGYQNVFAIGDIAAMSTKDYPNGHPQVAPVAIQQGRLVGLNLRRLLTGKEMKPFKYLDKGTMATIGRNRAVADFGRFSFGGLFAWLLWGLIHLMTLVGVRNRMVVFVNWVYNYFTYDRGTRLIIKPFPGKRKNRNHNRLGEPVAAEKEVVSVE
jgi:NADH dehydrogenase